MKQTRKSIGIGARAVRLAVALGLMIVAVNGPARAGSASETKTVRIVIAGPVGPSVAGKAEVQLRIFEGEDPDAPPNVTNIAVESRIVDPLAFPIVLEVALPKARLVGAMRPAVGAIIVANGAMAYWTETIAPLNRSGQTDIRVAPVP